MGDNAQWDLEQKKDPTTRSLRNTACQTIVGMWTGHADLLERMYHFLNSIRRVELGIRLRQNNC
jgi:hypothetical protein